MVAPCWVTDVDWCWSVFLQELTNYSESTSSTQSLRRSNTTASNIGMVPSKENTTGTLCEILQAIDWCILFVEAVIICNRLFSLSDNWENKWFAIFSSVSTDTKVNLTWVLIILIPNRESKNRISWCLVYVRPFVRCGLCGKMCVERLKSLHLDLSF